MAGQAVTVRLGDTVVTRPRPLVMGILNVTPDSFSDGGRHGSVEAAVAHAVRMQEEGADVIDVGGESTRPGAPPVDPADEMRRVLPVLEALRDAGLRAVLSVDTRHAVTAAAALERGVRLVNDVTALADPEMGRVVARAGASIVLMHMQGTPQTMQAAPGYQDVVAEVAAALQERAAAAVAAGIDPDRIILDPGLGFGKRTGQGIEDNCDLLSGLPRIVALGHPVLVGASRKRFIGNVAGGVDVQARLPGSLAAAVAAAWGGAHILRVHDVAETVQALAMASAIDPSAWRGASGPAADPRLRKP